MDPTLLKNAIGSRWYHCCWRLYVPKWLLPFGEVVSRLFAPLLLLDLAQVLIALNILIDSTIQADIHAILIEVYHLILVPMATIIGLWQIFHQIRPGVVIASGLSLGTPYGMPSGDSLMCAMLSTILIRDHPGFAITLVLSVGAARLVRGLHTVPQVLAGWTFGAGVAFLWRTVDSFVAWNWAVALFLPMLAWFDPYLNGRTVPGNFNSPTVWCIDNFATIAFDVIVCPPPRFDYFAFLSMRGRLIAAVVIKLVLTPLAELLMKKGITISFV
jgi:hypothetical protein